MSQVKGNLTGGRQLVKLMQANPSLGSLLQRIISGVNTVADNTQTSAVGRLPAPPQISGVNAKISGEMLHLQINDGGTVKQGIHYFSEVSTNPNFSNPIVVHHGTSRCAAPVPLPTYDDSGNKQTYYVRSYSQYLGSDPSKPVVYGVNAPTGFNMQGQTPLTLLNSSGSGTASNSGEQGGWGLGKVQSRSSVFAQTVHGSVGGTPTDTGSVGGMFTVNGV